MTGVFYVKCAWRTEKTRFQKIREALTTGRILMASVNHELIRLIPKLQAGSNFGPTSGK